MSILSGPGTAPLLPVTKDRLGQEPSLMDQRIANRKLYEQGSACLDGTAQRTSYAWPETRVTATFRLMSQLFTMKELPYLYKTDAGLGAAFAIACYERTRQVRPVSKHCVIATL